MRLKPQAFHLVFAMTFVTILAGACQTSTDTNGGDDNKAAAPKSGATASKSATPAPTAPSPATPARQLGNTLRGTVKETLDSGGYTYILLATDQGEVWAAAGKFAVAVGDEVELAGMQPMRNFRSRTLDRVFEEIQFVSSAKVVGGSAAATPAGAQPSTPALPEGHPPIGSDATAQAKPAGAAKPAADPIEKLADGVTVENLFAKKADFAGKTVKFRGRVVKVSRGILGSNWLHIQDGTGGAGTNDITVTSKMDVADVGSVVVIEGTLGIDRDFGSGYKYGVIVEDATITPDTGK